MGVVRHLASLSQMARQEWSWRPAKKLNAADSHCCERKTGLMPLS